MKALAQLNVLETFDPVDEMKPTKKTESVDGGINYFLKQNYNKYIKGRALFDGIKHQETFNKQKDYSPTVAADSVILTEAVNAHEGWYMVTFDLPKVYVHT